MSYYDKMINRLCVKTFKTTGCLPAIKTNKSGFSIGSYSSSYEKFFIRKLNDSDDTVIDYSLFGLWYLDSFLQTSLFANKSTYFHIEETIRSFVDEIPNDEKSNFLKDLLFLVNSDMEDMRTDDCLIINNKLLRAVSFLRVNYKCLNVCESNSVFIQVLMLYCKSTEAFFKLLKLSLVFLPYFLQVRFEYFDKKTVKTPSYKVGDKQFTNTMGYNLSQVIKIAIELSTIICKNDVSKGQSIDEMLYLNDDSLCVVFNNSNKSFDSTIISNKYLSDIAKSLESSSICDDCYGKYVKTGDMNYLIQRYSDRIDLVVNGFDDLSVPEFNIECILHLLKIFGKKLNRENYSIMTMSFSSIIILSQDIVIQASGDLFITNGYINELISKLEATNDSLESLNEKHKVVKGNSKQYKKSAEEAKQVRYKLETKLKKMEVELSKLKKESIAKSDFDALEESYNELLSKIRVAEKSLKDISDKLAEKTNECSRLIKENKQYKSQILQIKGLMSELNIQTSQLNDAEVSVSLEDKISHINQFNVVIIGGLENLYKSLQQMGYVNFTKCSEISDIPHGSKYDAIIVCTNFCSHAMLNHARSCYKNIEFLYFNNDNASILVDIIYSYFIKKFDN